MLYISLILSAILLVVANWLARRSKVPILPVALSAAAFTILPVMLTCFFPALALQAILLCVAVLVWAIARWRFRHFLVLSCAATAVAYLVVGWSVYQEHSHLREQFPYVSMEKRLPVRKSKVVPAKDGLPLATAMRLEDLEGAIEFATESWTSRSRAANLRQLHENTVQAFVDQPGFGVARMPRLSQWALTQGMRAESPVPQPVPPRTSQWSAAALLKPTQPIKTVEVGADLFHMHQAGVLDFLNPKGFGFIKDRQHVAGFQPHQFSEAPPIKDLWVLQTLDLVGLAMHDKPVAYVSAHLPKMDELRTAPTRPLDAFEQVGLPALRKGEDMFVVEAAEGRRMLGALRSTRQCLSCHDGERGELLGAFSYTLVQAPR